MEQKWRTVIARARNLLRHYPRPQSAIASALLDKISFFELLSASNLLRLEGLIVAAMGQPLSVRKWDKMTFNDKVTFRRLKARDPILTVLSDKLLMREFVSERVGMQHLPRLITSTTDVNTLRDLEGPFVVKANHGSGWVIIVPEERTLTGEELKLVQSWLEQNYGKLGRAWGYLEARPAVLVEELLTYPAPPDFKIFSFDGVPRFIQVDIDRFESHRRILMTPEWQVAGGLAYDLPLDLPGPPPHLSQMLEVSNTLGKGFDFIRIDFYDVSGQVYVGELTPYPGAGNEKFHPTRLDHILGGFWNVHSA
jgi:hypothetical protein